MNLLDLDARWRRLNDPDYVCPCCGRSFGGLIDIGFGAPDDWPFAEPEAGDVVAEGEDKLSSELCRLGARRFLRAHLAFPVRGAEDAVHLAPWAEVAPEDFYEALDRIEAGESAERSIPATLANILPAPVPGLFTGNLILGAPDTRPRFAPDPGSVLAEAASGGLSFDALLDLYAGLGEDLRPHLTGQA
ncbi:hypothetical protein SAMN05421853_10825 [Roseivivax halotolerans]|uniref:DUF2199 domain-containing protein n=1 Tax=Roseivivax halotolerans TaxID=93684 RepID=A0A1I5Z641_9RHOB|nr:DUF2199 domain-containing protein [Roseivivax halotolerans]SFQ51939.1 hypothetical protein SAMN05421853_10825 [Roseivivax halotolerans]